MGMEALPSHRWQIYLKMHADPTWLSGYRYNSTKQAEWSSLASKLGKSDDMHVIHYPDMSQTMSHVWEV